ncbi:MAG: recombinase family protein, partial [Chloroflexota bacterium]|nr:recombinase family protein [Chloroflexota bacterium]
MTLAVGTKRAVGYFRVSDPHQTGERHSSLETQEERFRLHCQRHGYTAVATFTDVKSGRRDDRHEYQRMLAYIPDAQANVIVVQWLDRFGRKPREILRRYWALEEQGVAVEATDEDLKEELILLIKAGLAGAESRKISERVKANMGRAIAKGVHVGRPPYGLHPRKAIEGGKIATHWEIDPKEAPIVREMYRLAVEENKGYKAIADTLNDAGHRNRSGNLWGAWAVAKIFGNEAIMGTLTWGKEPQGGNV